MTELSGYARALLRHLEAGHSPRGYCFSTAIELRDAGYLEPWWEPGPYLWPLWYVPKLRLSHATKQAPSKGTPE